MTTVTKAPLNPAGYLAGLSAVLSEIATTRLPDPELEPYDPMSDVPFTVVTRYTVTDRWGNRLWTTVCLLSVHPLETYGCSLASAGAGLARAVSGVPVTGCCLSPLSSSI